MKPIKTGYIVFPLMCACLNTACVSLETKNMPKNKNITGGSSQVADLTSAEHFVAPNNWALNADTNAIENTTGNKTVKKKTSKSKKKGKTSNKTTDADTQLDVLNQKPVQNKFMVTDSETGEIIMPRSVQEVPATTVTVIRTPVTPPVVVKKKAKKSFFKRKPKNAPTTQLDVLNESLKVKPESKVITGITDKPTSFENNTGDEKPNEVQSSVSTTEKNEKRKKGQLKQSTQQQVIDAKLDVSTAQVNSNEPIVLATVASVQAEQNQLPKSKKVNRKELIVKNNSPQYDKLKKKYPVPEVVLGANNSAIEKRAQIGRVDCLSDATVNSDKKLDLMAAIERAICNNPDTKNAWVETKIRAAQEKIAESQYYPQVSATADYVRGKSNTQYANTDLLTYDSKIKRYGVAVQATWLLYDFGSRKQRVKESENLLAMSFAQQDSVLQNTMLQAIETYYEVLKVEVQIDNAKQLESFAKKNYDIATARYNAGAGIRSDQLQMHANWVKAKSDLIKLSGDLKVAKGNLAAVMGNMAYQDYNVHSNSLKEINLIDLKPIQELLTEAGKTNPQLKQSQYAINAAQHKVKSIERSRYPSVSFISNFNNYTQDGEGSYANTSQQMQTGVQLSFPIFDGFNRKNQIVEARQLLQQKYVEKEKVEQKIVQDVWKNYNLLQASIENINALKALSNSAEQSYSVSQGRYQAGVGNILELINAQNLLTESKVKYSTALTEYLVIRFQLLSNVGTLNVW